MVWGELAEPFELFRSPSDDLKRKGISHDYHLLQSLKIMSNLLLFIPDHKDPFSTPSFLCLKRWKGMPLLHLTKHQSISPPPSLFPIFLNSIFHSLDDRDWSSVRSGIILLSLIPFSFFPLSLSWSLHHPFFWLLSAPFWEPGIGTDEPRPEQEI